MWKLGDNIIEVNGNNEYIVKNLYAANNFTDLALLSFVKIMIGLTKSASLFRVYTIKI